MENLKTANSELIEFSVTDTGKDKILFPQENRFRDREITGIEFISGSSGQKALSGNPISTANQLQNVFLTLDIQNVEKVKEYPAALLTRQSTNGQVMQFDSVVVNASKSMIIVSDLAAFSSTPTSVCMIVYFKDKK